MWSLLFALVGCAVVALATDPIVNRYDIFFRDIYWIGDHNILVIATNYSVYMSFDDGKTLQNINAQLGSVSTLKPRHAYINPFNNDYVFLRGGNNTSWRTTDGGKKWTGFESDPSLRSIEWHPTLPATILASSNRGVFFSDHFGSVWNSVCQHCSSPTWGDAGQGQIPATRIYFHDSTKNALVQTDDFGATTQVIEEDCDDFLFRDHHIVCGNLADIGDRQDFLLNVSADIGQTRKLFRAAKFPFSSLDHNAYRILDDHTGSIFIGSAHASHWGNVYSSDSSGAVFTASMQHVHQEDTYFDFEDFKGLDGIHLVNDVLNYDSSENSPVLLRTWVSFDNGGEYHALTAPATDMHGQPYPRNCQGQLCPLQLHGWTSVSDRFGPFYTRPTAIGIVMANGNVGSELLTTADDTSVFISRDAGNTFKEIKKGPTVYEMGDHGGLIILADWDKSTDVIYYSIDEGETTTSFKFSENKINVYNIEIEEEAKARTFLLSGFDTVTQTEVIISINFDSILTQVCTENDYEEWSPSDLRDSSNGNPCFLGRTSVYKRKKQTALCHNDIDKPTLIRTSPCACSSDDFECEFGYSRSSYESPNKDLPCTRDSDTPPPSENPPAHCPINTFYTVTQGYRKVVNDSCLAGVSAQFAPKRKLCPGSTISTPPPETLPPTTGGASTGNTPAPTSGGSSASTGPAKNNAGGGGSSDLAGILIAVFFVGCCLLVCVLTAFLFIKKPELRDRVTGVFKKKEKGRPSGGGLKYFQALEDEDEDYQ